MKESKIELNHSEDESIIKNILEKYSDFSIYPEDLLQELNLISDRKKRIEVYWNIVKHYWKLIKENVVQTGEVSDYFMEVYGMITRIMGLVDKESSWKSLDENLQNIIKVDDLDTVFAIVEADKNNRLSDFLIYIHCVLFDLKIDEFFLLKVKERGYNDREFIALMKGYAYKNYNRTEKFSELLFKYKYIQNQEYKKIENLEDDFFTIKKNSLKHIDDVNKKSFLKTPSNEWLLKFEDIEFYLTHTTDLEEVAYFIEKKFAFTPGDQEVEDLLELAHWGSQAVDVHNVRYFYSQILSRKETTVAYPFQAKDLAMYNVGWMLDHNKENYQWLASNLNSIFNDLKDKFPDYYKKHSNQYLYINEDRTFKSSNLLKKVRRYFLNTYKDFMQEYKIRAGHSYRYNYVILNLLGISYSYPNYYRNRGLLFCFYNNMGDFKGESLIDSQKLTEKDKKSLEKTFFTVDIGIQEDNDGDDFFIDELGDVLVYKKNIPLDKVTFLLWIPYRNKEENEKELKQTIKMLKFLYYKKPDQVPALIDKNANIIWPKKQSD